MNDNKLNLIPVLEKGQTYNASTGTLILNNEGSVFVTIKQYQEDEKKIKELEKKKKSSLEFARQKWEQHAKEGWSKRKLDENYDANMQDWEKLNKESQAIIEKYENINWCWQLVGNKLDYNNLSHNQSFSKGISQIQSLGKQKVSFPALLVGGGMAWLEAFHEKEGPMGKIPNGIFVKAKGTPKILRTEWTDFNYQPIKESIGFMSKVILHIYTSGMYGQEVEIKLIDRDLFTGNDELNFSGQSIFVREVNVLKVKKNDIGKAGVSDLLKSKDNTTDNIQYTQKIEVEVLVEAIWEKEGGKELKIFPIIKSIQDDIYFENFERSYLSIAKNGLILTAPNEVSNKVAVVGAVETNESAFHPCKYTAIELKIIPETEKEKNRIIFKENNMVSPLTYNIPIICADTDHFKDYEIELNDLETKECQFDGKSNNHKKNSISILKTPENYKITKNDGKTLNFKAAFNYHPSNDNLVEMTSLKMFEYIWPVSLRDDNKHALELRALTCRHDKRINIIAYPDVKWALDFRFGMKGPEQYTHTNLPNYPRNSDEEKAEKKPQSRHSDSFEKAKKAGRINTYGMEKRANGMELEFQLVLKAEYNKGEEIELAEKYAQKIKKFLELLLSLKEGLDTLTNIDKVNSGHKSAVKGLGKFLKSPIIGTIDYPAISVGAKWQAAIKDETNEVYTDGKIFLRFNPLLKGDISLDIIAAASYVPAFGQAVKAIEIALNTAGAELNFLFTIFGQVNVEFEYALAEKGGSNLNLNGELGLKLALSGKVKVNFNAIIFSVDGEIQAEAYAVSSIKPKASIGHDKNGTFIEAKCDFMGINIVCIITAKGKNNQIQYKDTYNVFDRKDDFVKGKTYLIGS
ncbi:hypothetical protein [Flavobacterium flavigenum]|uniref:hypothetical protein n=1 Tax=Flavobacterium flavigenum TaxID=3003258 RepID=UPI0024822B66|nr:hypothetical protein [Flavobacterium flavigenum]